MLESGRGGCDGPGARDFRDVGVAVFDVCTGAKNDGALGVSLDDRLPDD